VNPGLFFLVFAVTIAVVRGPAGRLSDRFGRAPLAASGLVLAAAALVALAFSESALGLALAVSAADCLPILFSTVCAVGAAHSGWRGTAAGIPAVASLPIASKIGRRITSPIDRMPLSSIVAT